MQAVCASPESEQKALLGAAKRVVVREATSRSSLPHCKGTEIWRESCSTPTRTNLGSLYHAIAHCSRTRTRRPPKLLPALFCAASALIFVHDINLDHFPTGILVPYPNGLLECCVPVLISPFPVFPYAVEFSSHTLPQCA